MSSTTDQLLSLQKADIEELTDDISRSTTISTMVTMIGIGLLAFSSYVAFSEPIVVDAKLEEAKSELRQSEAGIEETITSLEKAIAILDAKPSSDRAASAALREINLGQENLIQARSRVQNSQILLDGGDEAVREADWLPIVETYVSSNRSRRLAIRRAEQLRERGFCAATWIVKGEKYIYVGVGLPTEEAEARKTVTLARDSGIAEQAYVMHSNNENFVPLGNSRPRCTTVVPSSEAP